LTLHGGFRLAADRTPIFFLGESNGQHRRRNASGKVWGSPLNVAEALILGKLRPNEEQIAPSVIDPIILEAARIRLEAMGLLNQLTLMRPE
jgi:hypothetical protein